MKHNINAILFDIGATLRVVVPDAEFSRAADLEMMRLVNTTDSYDVFFEKLNENFRIYRKHAKSTLLDVSEMELWMQWLLPDYPKAITAKHAGTLTRLWREHNGRRVAREGVEETIVELRRRGYELGIIANTFTENEIPNWLVEDGLAEYFKAVILSSKVRLRKPDPAIYLLAARAMDMEPAKCAYIGDNARRDVEGTFNAGYGLMIRILDETRPPREEPSHTFTPHHHIRSIPELLDIFPPLENV
ncbi:HAD family hydrolase [Christensenellaceae bacterium OttesenSCG-928-L17]|nr:HAD family hydrolase [Christensenellaceae bacterium OttesenSCG-928-L17]